MNKIEREYDGSQKVTFLVYVRSDTMEGSLWRFRTSHRISRY